MAEPPRVSQSRSKRAGFLRIGQDDADALHDPVAQQRRADSVPWLFALLDAAADLLARAHALIDTIAQDLHAVRLDCQSAIGRRRGGGHDPRLPVALDDERRAEPAIEDVPKRLRKSIQESRVSARGRVETFEHLLQSSVFERCG
jgi:hypothetical protein